MALRIYDTDPDARPKKREKRAYEEYAFQFRTGRVVNGRPVSLAKWRVLAGDPQIAEAISLLMGGTVDEWDLTKEMCLEVLTDTDSVEIVVSGPDAIEDKMILWGRSGPIHECDGEFFLSPPEDAGKPCGCPRSLKERKAAAKAGRAPSPSITVPFRLAHDYDLGLGKFTSSSWKFAETIHEVKNELAAVGEEALCRLSIELVEFDLPDGEHVKYRKPRLEVLGSWNDAIAEPRD